ncbi:MAG: hypothetical protein CMI90_06030 [Pelagibacteraceae bacterium]|nr:hypothetical protein [Pelagibacteraceae bacterium]|tara:strand:+ start:1527 stop:1865 length:339 start_codon:yes stop_codon:yes gene_type:complete
MTSNVNKDISLQNSPVPSKEWLNYSEKDRINLVLSTLKSYNSFNFFEVLNADTNAFVTIKTEKNISASERGVLLLDLELKLKKEIDEAITVWLEPVGDKSKLRNLRGIEIKI